MDRNASVKYEREANLLFPFTNSVESEGVCDNVSFCSTGRHRSKSKSKQICFVPAQVGVAQGTAPIIHDGK